MYEFNIKKSMKNDAIFRIILINGIVFIILGIVFLFQMNEIGLHYPIMIGGGAILLFLPIRYLYLKNFIVNTVTLTAKVLRTWYYRGSKVVKYQYVIDEKLCTKRAFLNYNKNTKMLERDEEFIVAVKEGHPKQALIVELFYDKVNNA